MKYVKMLGLLAMAAAALMAFAGAASATTVTSSTGETPTIHATSVGYATLHNAVGTISCNSTVTGAVTSHGTGKPASGAISTLSFTGCTNGTVHSNAEGHVATPGSLAITNIAGGTNGTLTSSGATVTVTMFGVECGYSTNNTHIGTVSTAGEHAILTITAKLERHSGSFFCGTTGNWTGQYKVNHPTNLKFHA